MTSQPIGPAANATRSNSFQMQEPNFGFLCSAFMFRMGLALVTFEQDRFFEVQLSDYLFFLSLLLLLFSPKFRLLKSIKSGISLGGALIICGGLLSLLGASDMHDATSPLTRLLVLFGLFAPLAVIHSKNIRANLLFALGGISANCAVALISAWVFPGIVDVLSINPVRETDFGVSIGRFQGLSSHPNILGLSAALAVLIGVGLFVSEKKSDVRWGIVPQVLVCVLGGIVSGSRTFLASLIPGLIVFVLLQKLRLRSVVRALVALVVLWGALIYFAPDTMSQYSEQLESKGLESSGRLLTAAAAALEISQKPILGWGVGHFGEAGVMFIPEEDGSFGTHVTFLQYWYAVGLLGAIGFLALFVTPLRPMLRALREDAANELTKSLRLVLGCYVVLFIASNLNPLLFNRFLYVPMFLFSGFAGHVAGPVEARSVVHQHLQTSRRQISGGRLDVRA